jgi:Zn-dependent protease with chaperone function
MARAYQTFAAVAFHPDHGNEAIEGAIFFSNVSLTFQSGDLSFQIPFSQLGATFEEANDGRVIFRDSAQPDFAIATSDLEVLEISSVPVLASLREEVTGNLARGEMTRRIKSVVWFGVGCVLLVWLLMIASSVMVRSIAARVSPQSEKQQGDKYFEELKAEIQFDSDSNKVARLAAMAEPLLRVAPGSVNWQFHLAKEGLPNAFALPGGHIVVTTGLLELAKTPEEVLGPIAHEMAHVTCKHIFRHQIASAGPLLVLQLFLRGKGGAVGLLAGGSALLVNQSFSQEYEKEADDTGWDYLVAANIDPRGMISMFRKLKTAEENEKIIDIVPKAFQSHPDLDKRIDRMEKKWKRLRRKTGFVELKSEEVQ